LYHPFASAARDGVAEVLGDVLSTLKVFEIVVVPPSLDAEHVRSVPAVSVVNVVALQPVVERMTDSGSVTVQLTVTLVVYQPLLPSVPNICGVMTGGVSSPGTSGTPGAPEVSSNPPMPRAIRAASRRISR
jgi:hypothetical protein